MTVVSKVKSTAIKYARTHNDSVPWSLPWYAACPSLNLQEMSSVIKDAHSVELNPNTTHPVIHIMPDQIGIEDIGGTLRLGSYPCVS